MIVLCLDGGAITTMGVPWVPSTKLIWFLCCIQGIFEGVICIGKCIFYDLEIVILNLQWKYNFELNVS